MVVNIDENFVFRTRCFPEYLALLEAHQIESFLRQTVATESERLGIQKIAVDPFNPTALSTNIPGCTNMTGTVFELYLDAVAGLESAAGIVHGSPHLASNSASLRSISSLVRIFFSMRMASMLAIQRS